MALAALLLAGTSISDPALADAELGQEAPLFASIDEDLNPVDMADLIDGKPLVLVVSSAS